MGFLFERTKEEYELAKIASRLKMAAVHGHCGAFPGSGLTYTSFSLTFLLSAQIQKTQMAYLEVQ